jgi:hypothetical protein
MLAQLGHPQISRQDARALYGRARQVIRLAIIAGVDLPV